MKQKCQRVPPSTESEQRKSPLRSDRCFRSQTALFLRAGDGQLRYRASQECASDGIEVAAVSARRLQHFQPRSVFRTAVRRWQYRQFRLRPSRQCRFAPPGSVRRKVLLLDLYVVTLRPREIPYTLSNKEVVGSEALEEVSLGFNELSKPWTKFSYWDARFVSSVCNGEVALFKSP
jgi:hypothetical protein